MSSTKTNLVYNSIYQILLLMLPLLTAPYLSRIIGANGIGIYSYNYSIASYFSLFILLGLNNYGVRTIAGTVSDKEEISKKFWSIYFFQLILGIIISMLYLTYTVLYSDNFDISLIMGLYVISAVFDINWFIIGIGRIRHAVARNSIIKILLTVLIFVFVKNSSDLWIYCVLVSTSTLLGQLLIWPLALEEITFYRPTVKEITVHIKPNAVLFLSVVAVSVFKIMDKIMLGFLDSTSEVGYYELSERFILVPMALINSLGTVMLPRMSSLINKKSKIIDNTISKSILLVMFLSTSMCFGIMSISKEFIPLFYGSGFEKCITLILILMPSCIFLGFANVIRTQFILPNNMDRPYIESAFLGAICNLSLNFLLIPYYGAIGTAFGTLVAEMVVALYQSYSVRKHLDMIKYIKLAIPFLISGFIMFLVNYNLHIEGNLLTIIFQKIVIGIFVYILILIPILKIFAKDVIYLIKN